MLGRTRSLHALNWSSMIWVPLRSRCQPRSEKLIAGVEYTNHQNWIQDPSMSCRQRSSHAPRTLEVRVPTREAFGQRVSTRAASHWCWLRLGRQPSKARIETVLGSMRPALSLYRSALFCVAPPADRVSTLTIVTNKDAS